MSLSKDNIVAEIVQSICKVVGSGNHPLHQPYFNGNELSYLSDCITTNYVSSVGTFVDLFETKLAEFTGVKRAVATVNGTAALQIALKLSGVKQKYEVLLPALTFVATANSIIYLNAIPHFVDSNFSDLGINSDSLLDWLSYIAEPSIGGFRNKLTGRKLHAIIPVHIFGHSCELDSLLKVANDYKLILIEDASESDRKSVV